MLKDIEGMPMLEVMEIARKAELNRQNSCRLSALCYIRKRAREKGLTVEEYTQQRAETRGRKRIHYPDGAVPEKN